ncbi:potassium-transporting ATPase subunit C [Candidatus Mycobacterium methanotrophicum]|uniref:Potassium-transporting ATPase KdpC subunit n=1 Tax=Candidatus Mycobacterium methanotrophicum TaxID=2943498 RepID=A0ABY4QKI5_9MYCO|nr:potassium-transporting ATPase subunit C [Candidatus Mycobacterium methanotrophicum]UQX10500.1 potassium-transporting ATPase subunit C [Candidatus Mycobacterium methanotrophicum]
MKFSNLLRQHWAALRALLVMTVITGIGYPLAIWAIALLPGLHAKAEGSMLTVAGRPVGSKLIGQLFTDKDGNPLPQYFQSRPSAAGNGYDPLASGASNLGPESIVDTPADPAKLAAGADPSTAGFKPSLLTQVCSRSLAIGKLEKVDGSRPFCTGGGAGAVLSVIGPRDSAGKVVHPTQVVSVNEPCSMPGSAPTTVFQQLYEGVRVQCAQYGQDYSVGQIVPVRGAASDHPTVPVDAVTASASGLDPDISPAYAEVQVARVAQARGISVAQVHEAVSHNQHSRQLGFIGEPVVNVLQLNLELDGKYPAKS